MTRTPAPYPLDHGQGYSPLPRDGRNLEALIRDPHATQVWTWLHLRARHTPGWAAGSHGELWLEAGQLILGLRQVARELGGDHKRIDRSLAKLEKLGLIRQKRDRRGTIVSIVNYGSYGSGAGGAWDSHGYSHGYSRNHSNGYSHDHSDDHSRAPARSRDPGQPWVQQWDSDGYSHDHSRGDVRNGRTGERENGEAAARARASGGGSSELDRIAQRERGVLALWRLQEELRAEIPGAEPLGEPLPGALNGAKKLLGQGYTVEQVERSWRRIAADPEQQHYLDGHQNYSPRVVDIGITKGSTPHAEQEGEFGRTEAGSTRVSSLFGLPENL